MSDVVNNGAAAPSGEINTSQPESQGQSAEINAASPAAASSPQIDAINDAVENGEITQAEAKSLIKKFELKVRGKTIEREYDLGDEAFLKNQFQLAEVAKMSQQEKAEMEKHFERILQNAKGDPFAFMAQLGLDPDEAAAMHIEKKIAHLKKSPEMLEKEKALEELKAAREEAARLREEKEQAEMSKLQSEALAGLQTEISKAITAHTKLPDTKYVQKKMADAMLWAANNGFDEVTADDVAPLVEHEMRSELNNLYDMMPEDVLEAYVGRKNIDRLRKSKIAKAKEVPSVNSVKATAAGLKPSEPQFKEAEKIDSKKFWRGR